LEDYILLWDRAYFRLLDVRQGALKAGERKLGYRMPACGYLLTLRGDGRVRVDGKTYEASRFHVLHAGKGSVLDLIAGDEDLAYYLIFYKGVLANAFAPLFNFADVRESFGANYGYRPAEPLALYEIAATMHLRWETEDRLDKLEAKAWFLRFVHETLRQLRKSGRGRASDLAEQAARYIESRYAEPITLEMLAESLECGAQQLLRLFKSRMKLTPIHYLIQIRIERAKELLLLTDANLQDISERVGYPDSYYFNRLFKKYEGMPPMKYREQARKAGREKDNPFRQAVLSIGSERSVAYIDSDNHYRYRRKEEPAMNASARLGMTATLILCFSIFLGACSSGTATPSPTGSAAVATSSASPAVSASPSPETSTATKTVSTVNGEVAIPAHPQRIVADQYVASLIALGVAPIGAPGLHKLNPYLSEALEKVEDIGDVNGSLEKVVALAPDLILTEASGKDERYGELSKIAPTVSIPYGELKNAHEELTYFGKLLGREKEAEAWLAEYDRRIAEAKERVLKAVPAEATFTIMEMAEKSAWAYGDNFGRGGQAVYQALGFRPPEKVAKDIMEKQWAEVSFEAIPDYVGDYLILTSNTLKAEDLKGDPVLGTLDAVKNDRVYVWKEERSWYYDPIAVLTQTEELADWLTGMRK